MAFQWVFPPGTSEEVVTQSAGIGPVYLNDGFQLEWTPTDLRVTILLACDEAGATYFIGNRSYDASPGFWRLTDRPVSDDSPNCHFAYDGSDGNAKLFRYMNASNPNGSTTWSASTSTSSALSSSSTSTSRTSTIAPAQATSTKTTIHTTSHSDIAAATGTPDASNVSTTPQSHTNKTSIGVGVGVGVAVALIIALVAGLLLFRRNRRRKAAAMPANEQLEKYYMTAPPVELASNRAYELNGESQKVEMESQDKRKLGAVELG